MECAASVPTYTFAQASAVVVQAASIFRGGAGSVKTNAKCLLQDGGVLYNFALQFYPDQPLIGVVADSNGVGDILEAATLADAMADALKPHVEAETAGVKAGSEIVGAFNFENFAKNAFKLLQLILLLVPKA